MAVTTLQLQHSAEKFVASLAAAAAYEHVVAEPCLPLLYRKVTQRLHDGSLQAAFPSSVNDHCRLIYCETIDLITTYIHDRFNQSSYKTYSNV